MPAYIIVEIEILDPAGYEEYKKLAGATVEKYGGKYIVRGGKTEVLEGDWQPKRIVVLEFESTQPRAAQDAPPHGQDEHDPGGGHVICTSCNRDPVGRIRIRKRLEMTGHMPAATTILSRVGVIRSYL